ncbi:hypothetical protein PtA15_13A281 [Puccinia triticina]|uniref:Secreted protein n=1 Tax=Puccinia triticina TaxID=208348 RepID=A0ABY7D3H0_9BASI|nr:uncharacterized protein PtA15_13A281 [Puccinia triticina]WAQ90881.1 hypothetical protein PtA15_13A281 [Puccinia triticina]
MHAPIHWLVSVSSILGTPTPQAATDRNDTISRIGLSMAVPSTIPSKQPSHHTSQVSWKLHSAR